jgi:hypothetical protein
MNSLPPDDLGPDCGRVRGELAGFVYDELPPDARAALERHLDGCPPCREELAVLRDTRRMLARWETPPIEEDPRTLARAIAAEAQRPTPARAGRARLMRWSALLSGAAAAGLFVLSVLSARVSLDQGRLELSFGLPGPSPAAHPSALEGPWRDEMRTIAAQEVALRTADLEQSQADLYQRLTQMTREELLRMAQSIDLVLEEKQETFDARLLRLGQEARQADLETRRVLTDLVNYLPTQTDR